MYANSLFYSKKNLVILEIINVYQSIQELTGTFPESRERMQKKVTPTFHSEHPKLRFLNLCISTCLGICNLIHKTEFWYYC